MRNQLNLSRNFFQLPMINCTCIHLTEVELLYKQETNTENYHSLHHLFFSAQNCWTGRYHWTLKCHSWDGCVHPTSGWNAPPGGGGIRSGARGWRWQRHGIRAQLSPQNTRGKVPVREVLPAVHPRPQPVHAQQGSARKQEELCLSQVPARVHQKLCTEATSAGMQGERACTYMWKLAAITRKWLSKITIPFWINSFQWIYADILSKT